ncbi:hypothetical protein FD51_GL000245 [Lacticaseibacillus zeae DSM 20178 = KCTC 3804]|uniref:Uncharacterized protein n=1 Tax=Lacticaseibacillus zeae DSM 20178 = KCTC 3804 TaxID=1423816 RepID=A0A0R1EW89_LACZE|nr:hypothetical protein [Lacticaseibacillus zeae]KRK13685.1 hypothetical protein FD51_GL000245 [Lacticaseibacillus zeae DSM 20178 = KCTC 3804]
MAQRPEEITNLLQDALHSQHEVAIDTIDRSCLKGRVVDIKAGKVKPYNERGVITVATGRGAKRIQAYAISQIKYN